MEANEASTLLHDNREMTEEEQNRFYTQQAVARQQQIN